MASEKIRAELHRKREEALVMDREKAQAIMQAYCGPGGRARYPNAKIAQEMRERYLWAYRKLYGLRPEVIEKRKMDWRERGRLKKKARKEATRPSLEVTAWYRKMWTDPVAECFYCHASLETWERQGDHYTPLSKGGEHCVANLRISCASCNARKGNLLPEDFFGGVKQNGCNLQLHLVDSGHEKSDCDIRLVPAAGGARAACMD